MNYSQRNRFVLWLVNGSDSSSHRRIQNLEEKWQHCWNIIDFDSTHLNNYRLANRQRRVWSSFQAENNIYKRMEAWQSMSYWGTTSELVWIMCKEGDWGSWQVPYMNVEKLEPMRIRMICISLDVLTLEFQAFSLIFKSFLLLPSLSVCIFIHWHIFIW